MTLEQLSSADEAFRADVERFSYDLTEGRTWTERDHLWHLDIADRLAAVAPGLVRQTKLLVADTTHEASTATGFDWWTELTAAGGEGMVVKPQPANLERLRQRGLGHKRSLVAREYAVRPAPRLGRW